MIQVVNEKAIGPRIYVVGVGGAGCNAVDSMYENQLNGVSFIAVNTDRQALALSKTETKVHIGCTTTNGLGTGADPELGKRCAEDDRELIRDALQGADLVFLTAGLGGGTGTGATPVIADIAKRELGALTVAIVTKPFAFEGAVRKRYADQGQVELRHMVDTLITVPNEKLMKVIDEHTTLLDAFQVSNRVLMQCVQSISDLITQTGLINLDFAAIRTIMNETGGAVMGVGFGQGPDKAASAFQQASSSPLMEEVVIEGARGILVNITGGPDLTLHEVIHAISEHVTAKADPDANILFGVVTDDKMQDELKVTILATGFTASRERSTAEKRDEISMPLPADMQDLHVPAYLRSSSSYEEQDADREVEEPEPVYTATEGRYDVHHEETVEEEPEVRGDLRRLLVRSTRRKSDDTPPSIFGTLM